MGQFIDLTGQRFGRLTVSGFDSIRSKKTYWKCVCDCGNECSVRSDSLRNGHSKSCGCYYRDSRELISHPITHGLCKERLYLVWCAMKRRCYNRNVREYKNYGGRGITVCEEWKNDFRSFYLWSLQNGYDKYADYGKCTIDRINVNKGYSPDNCRWTTLLGQARNRQNTIFLTANGKRQSAKEWAEETGINYATIVFRKKHGLSDEDCLSTVDLRSLRRRKEKL